jgi:hypothetical protein
MALQDTYYYNTTNTNTQDYLRKSFAGQMLRYAPSGSCPLFGLTSMLPEASCAAVEHGYFAKTMVFPSIQLNGAIADAVDTTWTVDSTTNVLAGDLYRVQSTGEVVRVASVDSGTTLTVAREIGASDLGAAIADNVVCYFIGNAFEQGSNAPASRLMNPTRVMNNTQIFRNTWALPGTIEAVLPIVGDSIVAESRTDCGMFHSLAIEASMLFGQKSGQIIGNQYLTTMSGIIETVRTGAPAGNTTVAGGTTTFAQLEAMVNGTFDVSTNGRTGNQRLMFVGGTGRSVINGIGRLSGSYQIVDGQTSFGLQFSMFRTSRGEFKLIEHPLLNSNDDWKKMALAVDLPSVRVPYLRRTKHVGYGMDGKYVQNGQDAVGGTLTTELTMEIHNPSAFAVVYGLTAAAA